MTQIGLIIIQYLLEPRTRDPSSFEPLRTRAPRRARSGPFGRLDTWNPSGVPVRDADRSNLERARRHINDPTVLPSVAQKKGDILG